MCCRPSVLGQHAPPQRHSNFPSPTRRRLAALWPTVSNLERVGGGQARKGHTGSDGVMRNEDNPRARSSPLFAYWHHVATACAFASTSASFISDSSSVRTGRFSGTAVPPFIVQVVHKVVVRHRLLVNVPRINFEVEVSELEIIRWRQFDSGNINRQFRQGGGGSDTPKRIREALMVKLQCWSYEGEYRWIADKDRDVGKLPRGKRYLKIHYDADRVKAIIFGCRASSKFKTYIRRNLPSATKYKQAVEGKDTIEIIPFDLRKHH